MRGIIVTIPLISTAIATFGLGLSSWYLIGGLFVSGSMFIVGLKEIPADPPHVGLITVWGARTEELCSEGLKVFLQYFPFFVDVILVKTERRNLDLEFESVRTRLEEEANQTIDITSVDDSESLLRRIQDKFKYPHKYGTPRAGGEVKIKISVTWSPESGNPRRVKSFINSGEDEGVKAILSDVLEEDARQFGRDLTWTEYAFGTDFISALHVNKLTGATPVKLDDSGKPVEVEGERQYTSVEDASRKEIAYFMEQILSNGLSDIRDLGIKISRLNLADVTPTGKLAEDAEAAAREVQQNQQRQREATSRIEEINRWREADPNLTFKEAAELIRIEDGKATEQIVRVNSSGNPLADAAAIFKGSGEPKE